MEIMDGKIVVHDEDKEYLYEIGQITAEFEEDIPDVIGVVRCTGITIESEAPLEINSAAETKLYNEFADVEYNDADGDGSYRDDSRNDLSKRTGVDTSLIEIEWIS